MTISLARSVSNRLGGARQRLARRPRLAHADRGGNVSTAIAWPESKGLAQLKLGPASNIVSEASCYVTRVTVDTKNHFQTGGKPTQASIQQRFADEWQLTPSFAFSSGIRTLVAGLVLVALLPNLTLGSIFWLGYVNTPWSRPTMDPPSELPMPASQAAIPAPVLSAPATLEAIAGKNVTFPIALDGTDGVPARSIIAVRGLPQGSKLSSGRPYDETEWNLKPDEIGDLLLVLPSTETSDGKLIIQLVTPDGAIIADTATALKMTAKATENVGASNIDTDRKSAQVLEEMDKKPEGTGVEEKLAIRDGAMTVPRDSVPLPTRRPAQAANDNDGGNWVKPLAFVNLRQRPTRSAPAVGVVKKGAKLRVLGRKNRWVQVTNPASSESGWIYAGNIASVR